MHRLMLIRHPKGSRQVLGHLDPIHFVDALGDALFVRHAEFRDAGLYALFEFQDFGTGRPDVGNERVGVALGRVFHL